MLFRRSNPLLQVETSSPLGIAYPTGTMSQRALAMTCKQRRCLPMLLGGRSPKRKKNCARFLGPLRALLPSVLDKAFKGEL